MKNFLLFFEEKEGSTAVIQILDGFGRISIVRRQTESGFGGWEPFEWFNCGSLGRERFRRCLQLIFRDRPLDLAQLNHIYTQTARAPLRPFDTSGSIGFKMRISPPWDIPSLSAGSRLRRLTSIHLLTKGFRRLGRNSFRRFMAQTLSDLDVVVFVMVRQDIFRWAISKYHGDGTGRPGHLQFRVAKGDLSSDRLPKIRIDPNRFDEIIDKCVRIHDVKRWWADAMTHAGLSVHPLLYEDFLGDQCSFFTSVLGKLSISIDRRELEENLVRQIRLKKVHGSDISEYVSNHREITERYGDRFLEW
jgi:hypothetical protein